MLDDIWNTFASPGVVLDAQIPVVMLAIKQPTQLDPLDFVYENWNTKDDDKPIN